ncbi:MAG: hypothetical protein WC312_06250 [Candidatus Omnitrophota bacterium]|jgi:hypothetical protein
MKLISRLIILLTPFILLNAAYCVDIKNNSSYQFDLRGDDGDIITDRFSIYKETENPGPKISGFIEGQWNLDNDNWEKVLAGGQIETNLFKYFYLGQSIHFISGDVLDYLGFDAENSSIETTLKIGVGFPLAWKTRLDFRNEYSYNLEKCEASLNEMILDISYPLNENTSIAAGGKHTDRINGFDTDYLTLSIALDF